ncbi:helix-turn-helix domain-containing protein [Actinacidiphila sp. bgisy167]|uniref:helix-turn-helix domain-containing protein n=1 Tax=Actinacidiphila sp. bgisy167 TaxID=3413797 RepID=UPI003D74A925
MAHAQRDELLRQRWRDLHKSGFWHVHTLRIPKQYVAGHYRCWFNTSAVGDVSISEQYGDAVEGMSGGTGMKGVEQRRLLVNIMRSGGTSLTASGRTVHVPPGTLSIRNAELPWEFSSLPGTRGQALVLPYEILAAAGFGELPTLALVSQHAPEARLLLGQLQLLRDIWGELSPGGALAVQESLVQLLVGTLMAHGVSADSAFRPSLRVAARNVADSRLMDPDLSPAEVARTLSVSVRTLHRAFAGSDESLMAYVRRRRLERARQELVAFGGKYTLSAMAARWQFADASHFSRAFKRQFGESPSSLVY